MYTEWLIDQSWFMSCSYLWWQYFLRALDTYVLMYPLRNFLWNKQTTFPLGRTHYVRSRFRRHRREGVYIHPAWWVRSPFHRYVSIIFLIHVRTIIPRWFPVSIMEIHQNLVFPFHLSKICPYFLTKNLLLLYFSSFYLARSWQGVLEWWLERHSKKIVLLSCHPFPFRFPRYTATKDLYEKNDFSQFYRVFITLTTCKYEDGNECETNYYFPPR